MHARTRLAAALLAPALVLAGCGGGAADAPAAPGAPAGKAGPTPGQSVDKTEFLAATQKAMLDAKTYAIHTDMSSEGQTIRMEGVGDVSDPANPKAKVTMTPPASASASATPAQGIEMILVGQAMYMKMPAAMGGGDGYVKVPLSTLAKSGGQDISKLLNPAESLKMSEQAITKIVYTGQEEQGGENLRAYAVTMDPAKVPGASPSASPAPSAAPSPSASPSAMTYTVKIDDKNRMRTMDMNVGGARMMSRVDKFGEPVSIAAPPSDQVTQMPTGGPS